MFKLNYLRYIKFMKKLFRPSFSYIFFLVVIYWGLLYVDGIFKNNYLEPILTYIMFIMQNPYRDLVIKYGGEGLSAGIMGLFLFQLELGLLVGLGFIIEWINHRRIFYELIFVTILMAIFVFLYNGYAEHKNYTRSVELSNLGRDIQINVMNCKGDHLDVNCQFELTNIPDYLKTNLNAAVVYIGHDALKKDNQNHICPSFFTQPLSYSYLFYDEVNQKFTGSFSFKLGGVGSTNKYTLCYLSLEKVVNGFREESYSNFQPNIYLDIKFY